MGGVIVMLWVSVANQAVPLDARVATSSGERAQLAAQWGRPTVLFYEDRFSTTLNRPLKQALFKRGVELGLIGQVSVVAVANLEGLDWFPARGFALAAIRDAEKEAGIPVYVDWSGVLARPPWGLPRKTASVVVLDAAGQVRWQASGELDAKQQEEVFSELLGLLRR